MEVKKLLVCKGAACTSAKADDFNNALIEQLEKNDLSSQYKIIETGCSGSCDFGPIMIVEPENYFYINLTPEDAKTIVEKHFIDGQIVEDLLYESPETGEKQKTLNEIAFF